MKNKFNAVYFIQMNYSDENLRNLKNKFNLTVLSDVEKILTFKHDNVDVLFAPFELKITKNFLKKFNNLKVIISNTTSIPHIDVNACEKKKVKISALNDDKYFLDKITPTAEHTFGLLLACYRNIIPAFEDIKSGNWNRWKFGAPKMLSKMRIGILGFGRLGQKVSNIAESFGMKVSWFDPYIKGGEDSLKNMVKKIDILSIHASSNDKSYKIVNKEILKLLPRGSIVINTARGELLDIDALIDLLEIGHISYAALDTIDGEFKKDFKKNLKNTRIYNYINNNSNLLLTPHIGGSTFDAWHLTQKRVIEKCLNYLKKEF